MVSIMGSKFLSGGVGDLLLKVFCFWLRCLGLRDSIDPAHDLTLFCFLLGFLVIDGFRVGTGSSSIGAICKFNGGESDCDGADRFETLRDLSEDAELTGRDLVGDDSPPDGSCPKKKYFLGKSRGVEGTSAVLTELSWISSSEFLRCGADNPLSSRKLSILLPRIALAVFGRVSTLAWVTWPLFSFEDGLAAPVDIRDERLFETEWPGRIVVVLDASLDTKDKGRGINSIVSENPTRFLLDVRVGGESAKLSVSPTSVEGVLGVTFD